MTNEARSAETGPVCGDLIGRKNTVVTASIQLETERLLLVASTLEIARAEARDRDELARILGAVVHPAWPPSDYDQAARDFLLRSLEGKPDAYGFLAWCWMARPEGAGERPILIGGGGFKGPPDDTGTVEIGYSIVPEYYGRGLATEAVGAMTAWAFGHPAIRRVIAETLPELAASRRVLEKTGFALTGEPPNDPRSLRYALDREQGAPDVSTPPRRGRR